MKKILILLALCLAAMLVVVACNENPSTEDPATDVPTGAVAESEVTKAPSLEVTSEEPTEAPTVPPEWLTYTETEKIIEIPTEAPTEAPTEDPKDTTKPVTVLGTDKLTSNKGIYHLDNGIADNGDYVTIVPTGEDPYYYPGYNFLGARYVVIKYRTSNCDGLYMQLYLASNGTGPQDDSTMIQDKLVGDGNWNYLVIDTQSLIDSGKYNGTTVAYLRFDPLDPGYKLDENGKIVTDGNGNKLRGTMPEGASLDVAYIAFCHAPDTMQKMETQS